MAQAAEAVARRLIEEGFNAGSPAVADELVANDMVEHQWYGPDHAPGAEGVKAVIRSLRASFSDFRLDIEDVAVAGDIVWLRMTGTGTNDGPYMGNAPTGRTIRVPVFDALRVEDGKIVEHWGVPDRLLAMMQLGLLPSRAAARRAA